MSSLRYPMFVHSILVLCVLLCAPFHTFAQDPGRPAPAPSNDAAAGTAGPAQQAPQPQSPTDRNDPGRNVWSSPLAGFATAIGVTGLVSKLGLNESVASAVGGVLLVLPLIVAAFLAWQYVRRRRVLDPEHRDPRHT
jgi:hypothetical protein